jgi:glyoxylase-like metal-dependent hydrolase (beta-lactamase superfamily II)
MEVEELRPGLWRWTLPHPEWTPEEAEGDGWEQEVASHFLETQDGIVLVDPLVPPEGSAEAERFWAALDRDVERAGRPPAVLITIFWHARSSQAVRARYEGATVWAHRPAAELVRERVEHTHTFRVGDPLPGGVRALDARRAFEVLFWLPEQRALVTGDVLLGDREGGLRLSPESWGGDADPAELRASLRSLLDLPVELVLPAHGEPVQANAREALAAALAS